MYKLNRFGETKSELFKKCHYKKEYKSKKDRKISKTEHQRIQSSNPNSYNKRQNLGLILLRLAKGATCELTRTLNRCLPKKENKST